MDRVLVIDDDRFFREMYGTLLREDGYGVDMAASVEEALEFLRKTVYHLIITDLVLPGQSGMDLLLHVKKNDPYSEVIMVTSITNVEMAIHALKNGARDYLLKPVNHDKFRHVVAQCMKQRRLVNENIQLKDLFAMVQTAKNEWERTMDCIPQMVILTDTESAVKRCNRTFVKYMGKDFPEILGKNLIALLRERGLPVDDADSSCQRLLCATTNRWFELRSFPYEEKETPVLAGQVVIISDITRQKQCTEQMEEKNRQILENVRLLNEKNSELESAYATLTATQAQIVQQEKMASIGQLSAGVAHEINNPMGFITSNLTTLGKYVDKITGFLRLQRSALADCDKAVADRLREAERSIKLDFILEDIGNLVAESLDGADRVRHIVKDLKSFARADDGERVATDINGCVESAITISWNEIKYKATLERQLGVVPPVPCSPNQLNQVLVNLLINAVQAIEKEGRITVRSWHEAPWACISVSDTGCGIHPETISRVFEPFFTTKEVGAGTGLGLSISYDLIRRHGGDILVESALGTGTTFTIRLPDGGEKTADVEGTGGRRHA